MVFLWYGNIANIPAGYALCDGTQGTPDLRDKFVICSEKDLEGIAVSRIEGLDKQSGGATRHQPWFPAGIAYLNSEPAGDFSNLFTNVYLYPPCYALAYIMHL